MLLSLAAGAALVPCVWLVGSLTGVAATALAAEIRLNREVRRILRG
jgi:hypothetical protein